RLQISKQRTSQKAWGTPNITNGINGPTQSLHADRAGRAGHRARAEELNFSVVQTARRPRMTAKQLSRGGALLRAVNRAGQAFLLTQWRQKLFRRRRWRDHASAGPCPASMAERATS